MLWLSTYERMGLKLTPEMVVLQQLIKKQEVKIDDSIKGENK
jgi:hypothetical protein